MGFINIFASKEAYVYVKNNQLTLENNEIKSDFPLEDVNSVMIENLSTTISTYTLSKFAEYGILTFICDKNHLPCGVVLPFFNHYRTLTCYENQMSMSKPLQKQLWQAIIKNKISNQNEVLNICGGSDELKSMVASVLSGDSGNVEAAASLIYFKKLFGKDFKRREDNVINSFLNYGYTIIRGFVARSITVHGLMTFLGVNHKNQFNQFNLADDLMEVFRPVADLYVKIYLLEEKEMTTEIKKKLYNLINVEVEVDGQKQSVSYAIDLLVQSFVKSIQSRVVNLKPIKIIGLNLHQYE